jgi:hypothetical protein
VTGVVALRVEGRVVTHCCGDHRPVPGEASVCVCCPECVTNAVLARYLPEIRRCVARWQRDDAAPRLLRLRAAYRRVEHALAVEAMWDCERGEVRSLGEALGHAVAVLPLEYPAVHGRLT